MDNSPRAFKYVQTGPISPGQRPSSSKPRWAVAVTALLLFWLLVLRIHSQSNELQALRQARADVAAVTLNSEATRGEIGSSGEVLRTAPALLELNYLGEDFPHYQAVLRESYSGRIIWSGNLRRISRNGGFTLYLPAGVLPLAACTVHLYGIEPRKGELVEVAIYHIARSRSSNS